VPKSVEKSQGGKVTILWNQQVQTDRTVPNNKPDIIIRDNEKGTCMLIIITSNNRGDWDYISKSFRKYVSNVPGKHEVKELHKTAILGTAHILREVLM